MIADFLKDENIVNNLAPLDSLLGTPELMVEDHLKIAMLVKIYDTPQEIKNELKLKIKRNLEFRRIFSRTLQ